MKLFVVWESLEGDKDADSWPVQEYLVIAENLDRAVEAWITKKGDPIDDWSIKRTKEKTRLLSDVIQNDLVLKL